MIIIKTSDRLITLSSGDYLVCGLSCNASILMKEKWGNGDRYIVLGNYSTNERALEVMYEIGKAMEELEKELKTIEVLKYISDYNADIDRLKNLAIYETPCKSN